MVCTKNCIHCGCKGFIYNFNLSNSYHLTATTVKLRPQRRSESGKLLIKTTKTNKY